MELLVSLAYLRAVAHRVAVDEDGCCAQRDLWQLEHHVNLQNEVETLTPQLPLRFYWHAVSYQARSRVEVGEVARAVVRGVDGLDVGGGRRVGERGRAGCEAGGGMRDLEMWE